NHQESRTKITFPLESSTTMISLTRIFKSTNKVNVFSVENFDNEIMKYVCQAMGAVKIVQLELHSPRHIMDLRETVNEMLIHHHTESISVVKGNLFSRRSIFEFLSAILNLDLFLYMMETKCVRTN
ncbi:hypothetical protein PENTCL1PPCAC_20854, partial [Pristionchus entomophagus]